ncbi:DEAD/DEAH box helicase [Desertimonas flava]|uniref:DEAD/DEAH box helicase n=1 Tax=Desertimonas flava TaxID=2064846 RepID=UPI001968FE19|nr:DEAD/DEAH box helicase [Desertimonas flava]
MTDGADDALAAFGRLDPALQHHIVNSLGWRGLRPLQAETIAPILAGDHVLAMAPTAGGKTEAAVFPVLSRMLTEDWRGLTVLYLCPLRALLNNLHVRLEGYASLVGRSVGLWHGDVGQTARGRLLREPPDLLLTTPESLEAMLVSPKVDNTAWFGRLQTVVVDEAHAFVGDDRGWHLLALLTRLARVAGREVQRIALSATIGNPDDVLDWLTTACRSPRHVINPPAPDASAPDVTLDYVGNLSNAATVISRLHRGAKRLVFVDSRARAEKLAAELRQREVETFVSHGSLGLDERRRSEQAFAEARDCVIVATSTLELGIDVGDLDHVLQIDAPPTVAAFLQRLGRSGRRPGTTRNMTVLTTSEDALTLAAAVLLRWEQGFVEPTIAPPLPLHIFGQQLLALALQEGEIGTHTWREWLGAPLVFGSAVDQHTDAVVAFLVQRGYLVDTGGGMLSIGRRTEEEFGRRHFMELLAVFSAPPLFAVLHGRLELGHVPDEVLLVAPPGGDRSQRVLLLGGRSWRVTSIDWRRRVIHVEPSDERGTARWTGGSAPLSADLAGGVRDVLGGADPVAVTLSARARDALGSARDASRWVRPTGTTLVRDGDKVRWWTFAGQRANTTLASALSDLRRGSRSFDALSIALDDGVDAATLKAALLAIDPDDVSLSAAVSEAAATNLKFADCLPPDLVQSVVTHRWSDPTSVRAACRDAVTTYVGR